MKAAARTLALVLATVLGPPVLLGYVIMPVAASLGMNGVANLAFGGIILWSALLIPQVGMVPQPSFPIVATLAILQCTIISGLIWWLALKKDYAPASVVGFLSIVGISALAHGLIYAFGHSVSFSGP
jgi:hypothetical protein